MGIWERAPLWDEGLLTGLWMLQEWILQLIFKALPSVLCAFETLQGAEKSLHQVSPLAVSVVSRSHSFLLQTIACFPPMIDLWSSTGSGYLGTCSFMRWNSSYSTRCCKNHSWRLLKLVRNSPIDVRGFSAVSCSLVSIKGRSFSS